MSNSLCMRIAGFMLVVIGFTIYYSGLLREVISFENEGIDATEVEILPNQNPANIPLFEGNGHMEAQITHTQNLAVFVLKLPLQYSHPKRHENIKILKKYIPSLNIITGLHGNDAIARDMLTSVAANYSLYLSHDYWDKSGNPVHLGKVGLYTSFFKLFHLALSLPDTVRCAIIIEDDLIVPESETRKFAQTCRDLLSDDTALFYRCSEYNALNVYDISKLPFIMETIQETKITDPFDVYTGKKGWPHRSHRLSGLSKVKSVKSSITTQKKVEIDSWNSCLDQKASGETASIPCDLILH